MWRLRNSIACVALVAAASRILAAGPDELARTLADLAERTQRYSDRFVSIICTETASQQELRFNLTPVGKPRVTVNELSVTRDPRRAHEDGFLVARTLKAVNGRPARSHQEPGCTDPKTGTPEPLGFLLEANQRRYRFEFPPVGERPDGARALDFVEAPPRRVRVTWKGNCFNADGGGHEGRLWFDPATFDVLQIDVRLSKPFLVPMQHFAGLHPAIRVERWESTTRFARVNFSQPDETVLLPESIETLTVFRGAASLRVNQKLSDFRRFLAESSIRTAAY
jgi:hypothetical protein